MSPNQQRQSTEGNNCTKNYWNLAATVKIIVGAFVVYFFATQQQQQQRPFNGLRSGTTRVGRYPKKHSPTHTHPDHHASFIIFLHLQRSMASSLFNLRA